jgi:hypothetical protein
MNLRQKLASFGFESNDDFDFPLRCVLEAQHAPVRAAELVGQVLRRKTAFANALGLALEYPHRVYFDFTQPPALEPMRILKEDELSQDTGDKRAAKPLTPFERALTEACAFSESARTLLVLDQLQACDFSDQLRLFAFLQSGEWGATEGAMRAQSRNLLVLLISSEPLYHSLQKCCFRIFVDAAVGEFDFRPEDFGLAANTQELIDALGQVFKSLRHTPTRGELERLLQDCEARVRSVDQLRTCLFGRVENLNRAALFDPELKPQLEHVLDCLTTLLGMEVISLDAAILLP